MEFCNSRQGLLGDKSFSTFASNSDFVDYDDCGAATNQQSLSSAITFNNNNNNNNNVNGRKPNEMTNVATAVANELESNNNEMKNGIAAKFFIGDDDDDTATTATTIASTAATTTTTALDLISISPDHLLIDENDQNSHNNKGTGHNNMENIIIDDDDDSDDDGLHILNSSASSPPPNRIRTSNTETTILMFDQSCPTPCSSSSPLTSSTIPSSINPYGIMMMDTIKDSSVNNGSAAINIDLNSGPGPQKRQNSLSSEHHSIGSGWQIFIAVMVAASGNFIAGLILDNSKTWNVFLFTPELYYLVPILLSLKGNLEMTMVARLSTLVNMGSLKSVRRVVQILLDNICLVQTQAIVVSFLASIVTLLALRLEGDSANDTILNNQAIMDNQILQKDDYTMNFTAKNFEYYGDGTSFQRKCLLIFSTSLATANIACLLSTVIMITLTILLHYCRINPDNFVTALAASFGDIITSFLIGLIGEFINSRITYQPIFNNENIITIYNNEYGNLSNNNDAGIINIANIKYHDDLESPLFALLIIMFFIIIFPLLAWFTCRDESNKQILLGLGAWIPILLSMLIAFVSGFVLRFGAVEFNFMSLFQPLINGVGGNLAAITTSRYSTELHKQKAVNNDDDFHHHHQPLDSHNINHLDSHQQGHSLKSVMAKTFQNFLNDKRNRMILTYMLMAMVVHLFYGILAPQIHTSDHHSITWLFYLFYIPATLMQVLLLLILTRFFVDFVWWLQCDPDTSAIPILTSMGDILGTVFLYITFIILKSLNDESATPPLATDIDIFPSSSSSIHSPSTIINDHNDIFKSSILSTTATSAAANITTTIMPTIFEIISSTTTTTAASTNIDKINEPISMVIENLTSSITTSAAASAMASTSTTMLPTTTTTKFIRYLLK